MRALGIASMLLVACSATYAHWTPVCDPGRPENYVPLDLDDSLIQLYCTLDPELIREVRTGSEDDMALYHHGLGARLRYEWGLRSGSRLSAYFRSLGLTHPDDMSGVVLTSLWRRLNGQPLDLDAQVQSSQKYYAAQVEVPPVRCASGEEENWSVATDTAGVGVETYYSECPGEGWYERTKKSDTWTFIGPEPPFDADDLRQPE